VRALSVLLLALFVVTGLSASTAYVARELAYSPALGPSWLGVGTLRLYAPWAWLEWNTRYERHAPRVFRNASGITTLASLLGALVVAFMATRRKSSPASRAHGSSRWATSKEIARTGLVRDSGVVLCQTTEAEYTTRIWANGTTKITLRRPGHLVRHDGPEHVFCFAPTRSGKGVGLVIPTLLTWSHSVLVYDIKKENWALTAGWRRQFSHTWRFEPTAIDSVRFNPLFEIRRGLLEVKDTQNVADMLVDPTGEKESRDHWQTTAHSLLAGAILHVLYAEPNKTLAGVASFLSDPGRSQIQTLHAMLATHHLPTGPHPVVAQSAREMLNKSDNELSGVFSTAMACLGLYRDPIIARNTAVSDFRIADLMSADSPASLYLVVPPSDLARTRPIIRLMMNQIGRRLTESMEFGGKTAYRHKLLLLLDEFPSLGRLDFFETSLAFLAGYGLKALLIAQSLNQLEKAYGPHNAILDNCHVRLTYAPNDDKTAKRISDLLGQTTEKKVQKSYSGSGWFLSNRSESEQEYGRPLLTPAEVNQLPQDDGILLVGGLLPYRARKVRYFLDPRFAGRDALVPPNSPIAQAAELLPFPPNAWEGLLAQPPSVIAKIDSRTNENGTSYNSTETPQSAPAPLEQDGESPWAGFFPGQASTPLQTDPHGEREPLPL
jgi:type IV secretion system protein VirD4